MKDGVRAARQIAAYLAERAAITDRYREASRLATLEWSASGAGRDDTPPYGVRQQQFKADLEACEVRHFMEPDTRTGRPTRSDPRKGAAFDTPARLWRWIDDRLELYASEFAYKDMAIWGFGSPTPLRDALVKTYGHMHELDIPNAPSPESYYTREITESEARDTLRKIANEIRNRVGDSEPAPGPPPAGKPPAASGTEAPNGDPLTLDDRAVALLTRWLKELRPKISKRGLAEALKCHNSSLDDCPTFRKLWKLSSGRLGKGYRDATTGNVEATDDD
jgi:hypothetical protein